MVTEKDLCWYKVTVQFRRGGTVYDCTYHRRGYDGNDAIGSVWATVLLTNPESVFLTAHACKE